MKKPIIAITMGDPGGVGPEVTIKALQRVRKKSEVCYVVVGTSVIRSFFREQGVRLTPLEKLWDPSDLSSREIYFLDATSRAEEIFAEKTDQDLLNTFDTGMVSLRNACMAYATLEVATKQAYTGKFQGLVTAPVNKEAMRLVDSDFHGHTEYLAEAGDIKKYAMMFVSDRLKVTLVTIHVPLKDVASLMNTENIFEKIELTNSFLQTNLMKASPKLGVCALNPHGSEIGDEEALFIAPAVNEARKLGIDVSGPFSADQLFHEAYEGRFDALISMYHDQGLGPFKMIAFHDGVNVTLGLPFIRTSPDHGTAFDIAYQNQADASSMIASLKLMAQLLNAKNKGLHSFYADTN